MLHTLSAEDAGTDGSAVVSPEERERRLLILAEGLLGSIDRRQLVDRAMGRWSVSRRTAQAYVQEADERLHAEACDLPPVFALELSQLQRNRILEQLIGRTNRAAELDTAEYCKLVGMSIRLLDSRDRTAERMLKHQVRRKHAEVDALVADAKRQLFELEERDKAALGERRGSSERRGSAPPELGDPVPSPADTSVDDSDDSVDEDFEHEMDVAEWLGEVDPEPKDKPDWEPGEAERELYRQLEKIPKDQWLAYAQKHYVPPGSQPTGSWDERARPSSPAASPGGSPSKSPSACAAPCATSAAVAGSAGPSHHNPIAHKRLPTDRERRRKERKRLRRLRKRTRGRC